MKKKWLSHGITVGVFVIFILLGLASTSTTPSVNNNSSTNSSSSNKSSNSKKFFDFYEPFKSPEDRGYNVIRLNKNEEPKILSSSDINNDYFEMLSDYYVCLGATSFNGPSEDIIDSIKEQCKRIGATIALYSIEYAYTTGSYNIRRYDYSVYYFVKFTDDVGFGIRLTDLDVRERQNYKRNTGAVVYIVYKRTPAFYSNIFRGDIIVKINGKEILDADDGDLVLYLLSKGDTVNIEILRDGKSETIKTKY